MTEPQIQLIRYLAEAGDHDPGALAEGHDRSHRNLVSGQPLAALTWINVVRRLLDSVGEPYAIFVGCTCRLAARVSISNRSLVT